MKKIESFKLKPKHLVSWIVLNNMHIIIHFSEGPVVSGLEPNRLTNVYQLNITLLLGSETRLFLFLTKRRLFFLKSFFHFFYSSLLLRLIQGGRSFD